MSDRIAVMDGGKIIQVGTPEEVYEQPRTPFIARFFRGSNIFEAKSKRADDTDTLRLATLGTEITAPPVEFDITETVQFFVRSENVHAGEDENTVTGEVVDVLYRGELTDYTIRLESGDQFTATLSAADYEEGDNITLGWSTADTVVLHPDTE